MGTKTAPKFGRNYDAGGKTTAYPTPWDLLAGEDVPDMLATAAHVRLVADRVSLPAKLGNP